MVSNLFILVIYLRTVSLISYFIWCSFTVHFIRLPKIANVPYKTGGGKSNLDFLFAIRISSFLIPNTSLAFFFPHFLLPFILPKVQLFPRAKNKTPLFSPWFSSLCQVLILYPPEGTSSDVYLRCARGGEPTRDRRPF